MHFRLQLSGPPARVPQVRPKRFLPGLLHQNPLHNLQIAAEADTIEYLVRILGSLIDAVEHHYLIGLHGAAGIQHMRLTFQNRHLRQRLRDGHGGRTVHDHTQRPFRPVLTQEHHRLSEVGIVQCRRGHEKNAFTEWN